MAYIECDDTMSSRDLVEAIERSIGLPNGYGTIWRRVNGIREFFNTNKGYLLIIDEADKLVSKYTQKKMEILRAVFDQSDVGLVIAGEPKLEAQIKTYLVRWTSTPRCGASPPRRWRAISRTSRSSRRRWWS